MSEKEFDKLNDLSCNMEHMTNLMTLAEQMLAELACSDITDDKEKERLHISRLWSLVTGMVELQHQREQEIDDLMKKVTIIKGGVA